MTFILITCYHRVMSTKQRTSKRPTEIGTLVGVRLQDEALTLLDNWRRKQPDLPNRPEAMRRLMIFAIKQWGKQEK